MISRNVYHSGFLNAKGHPDGSLSHFSSFRDTKSADQGKDFGAAFQPPQHNQHITSAPAVSTLFYRKVPDSPICTGIVELSYGIFHLEKSVSPGYYIATKR
jgi:hypothetical protein